MPDEHVPTREIVDVDDQGNSRPGPASYAAAGPLDPLVAFLRARYDEREALARAVVDDRAPGEGWWTAAGLADPDIWRLPEVDAALIAASGPDFELDDIAAKRQIMREHRVIDGRCHVCTAIHDGNARRFRAPCPTLRLLALPFAGHPDYREEWKP